MSSSTGRMALLGEFFTLGVLGARLGGTRNCRGVVLNQPLVPLGPLILGLCPSPILALGKLE